MISLNDSLNKKITPPSLDDAPRDKYGNIILPNIKELLLADPGYVIVDVDLEQADAAVVAWEADDDELKDIFRDPDLDLHTINAKAIFGFCPDKKHPNRQKAKAGVHAVNYHVFAPTLAKALGITTHEAQRFIDRWFDVHPKIADWHKRINNEMMGRGWIENRFGYRKNFLDRRDGKTALSEALAWIPQSTVGIVINKAWDRLARYPEKELFVSMQVHDSLVFQVKMSEFARYLNLVCDDFKIVVPYDDPLIIGTSIAVGPNVGKTRNISWEGYYLDANDHPTDQKCIYLGTA